MALADLIALDDVLILHRFASLGVNSLELDAIARIAVDLVEPDLFAFRTGGIERYRARDERQSQVALPVRTWRHDSLPLSSGESRLNAMPAHVFQAVIALDESTSCPVRTFLECSWWRRPCASWPARGTPCWLSF